MPSFSQTSFDRLASCDVRIGRVMHELIRLMDISVLDGHRGEAKQTIAFESGKSKVHWPDSKHNAVPSLAVDIAPYYRESPHIRWPSNEIMANPDAQVFARYAYMAGLARGLGHTLDADLRSGLDWNSDGEIADNTFNDLPHIEIKT